MDWRERLIVAIASIITAGMSLWAAIRRNQLGRDRQHTEHTETILGGYSQIVDDLRAEVLRLNSLIEDMRIEQEECERRNKAMELIVAELQARVCQLEGVSSDE